MLVELKARFDEAVEHPLGAAARGGGRPRHLRHRAASRRTPRSLLIVRREPAAASAATSTSAPATTTTHGAPLHRLRPPDARPRDRRGRLGLLQPAHRLLRPAAVEARRSRRLSCASASSADRARARARRGRPARGHPRQDELARGRGHHPRALRRGASRACRSASTCAGSAACGPGSRASSETIEVVSIVDRFLEHARIFHFAQRRRRRGLPLERRLDAAQPRPAHRAALPGALAGVPGRRCWRRSTPCSPTT